MHPGGIVVYSVPVGESAVVEFNAHRRFRLEEAMSLFAGWQIVDSCMLGPSPEPIQTGTLLNAGADPVACFCVRKPVLESR